MWLEELLPQEMPNARVMLFAYNCRVTGEKSLLSAKGLTHAAEALLAALNSKRVDPSVGPRVKHDIGLY